jgi:hypothetical protein
LLSITRRSKVLVPGLLNKLQMFIFLAGAGALTFYGFKAVGGWSEIKALAGEDALIVLRSIADLGIMTRLAAYLSYLTPSLFGICSMILIGFSLLMSKPIALSAQAVMYTSQKEGKVFLRQNWILMALLILITLTIWYVFS